MYLGEVIKQYRKDNNISMQAFADKCNLSKGYIAMLEKNLNSKTGEAIIPSLETFIKSASAMNMSIDDLLSMVDENQPIEMPHSSVIASAGERFSGGNAIPILSTVVAGMPIDAYEDILGYEEVNRKLGGLEELYALKVIGDSMLPVLQEDDIVIVRQQADVESGDIAIVLVNGDTATVKKVMKSDSGITLIAFNPSVYEPHFYSNEEIESLPIKIAGKVVEMKRRF